MRKVIIDERAMNPKYYDRMSELLDALIEQRRQERHRLQGLPRASCSSTPQQLGKGESDTDLPGVGRQRRHARARRLRLPGATRLAVEIDDVVRHTKPDAWVGNPHEGAQGQASAIAAGSARGLRPARRAHSTW